jgi:metallo-beta-lactamase family protein
MKLSFHGAARTVTGSKHLLSLKNGINILFDCGMFQGLGKDTVPLNQEWGFEPSSVKYLLLSHAHIDHCGLLPKLVKDGFNGKIFCTAATKDLANILLLDSAEIQRDDAEYSNKKRAKRGEPLIEPLYTVDDAKKVFPLMQEVSYGQWTTIEQGLEVLYTDAGHIIGSAAVHLRVTEDNQVSQITFSGDVGRYGDAILKSPEVFPQADHIIIESTYGNKLHESLVDTADQFLEWINKTCIEKKGKLIIPAFSVGRTQELLYFLNQLELEKRLPKIPVYVDSPLSKEATDVVKSHPEGFNKYIRKLLLTDSDPFDFPGLKFIHTAEESKQLNFLPQPCVIISASGMADAGRIKHHIKNNVGDARNTILIVGYSEPNSLGGRLMNGEKRVRIFREEYDVRAEIGIMRSMSAHGDYDDLCQFLACQDPSLVKNLFIVHGEYNVQLEFQKRLMKKGFREVEVPALHSMHSLA